MTDPVPPSLRFDQPVTLVGDGAFDAARLAAARAIGPLTIAADGAADRLADLGVPIEAVIGDMDSIGPAGRDAANRLIRLDEQDTTDFEKCLYATEAPLYLAVGFTGARLDHTLAVLHGMVARRGKRVLLLGEDEIAVLVPPHRVLELDLPAGARVSIYPLLAVSGTATGLRWPMHRLALAPGRRIGTSNTATGGPVTLSFDGPGVLLMIEQTYLTQLAHALTADRLDD